MGHSRRAESAPVRTWRDGNGPLGARHGRQPVLPRALAAAAPRRPLHGLRPCGARLGGARRPGAGRPHLADRREMTFAASVHRALPALARRVLLVVLALVGTFAPSRAVAQSGWYGTNKIQYRNFEWRVLKGPHVDLYYYPSEERIARMALAYAEESVDTLELRFHHSVKFRIPLIIYASHSDFEQTNVLPFVPPEGILGVTEYLKQRVTIPFRGSYAEFRHTLRHELVHVFQLSLAQQRFQLYPRGHTAGTPLWWSEGLAEYWSSVQDSRDEMIVRDLSISGRMPSIRQLGMTWSP